MNKHFFFLLFLLPALVATAQPNKKVGPAMSKFLNTEFMVKYRDLRIEAESAAIQVQSSKDELQPADVYRLRTAYDQTATRANQIIEGVKQDFLNAKKLKSIAEFPDMYSDGLRYKLQALSEFYAANFQQVVADATVAKKQKEQVDGSAVLLLVVELIGLTRGLTNYFAEIKKESRQYTENQLQEHLVQPYRWRYWDELAGNASPYEKFEKSAETTENQPPAEDPLDHQLQKMNEAIQSFPEKSGMGSSTNFEIPGEGVASPDSSATFQYEDWTPTQSPVHNRDLPAPTGKGKVPVNPAKPGVKTIQAMPKQTF